MLKEYKVFNSKVFLINKKIIINLLKKMIFSNFILEIGPGYGSFTDFLVKKKFKVIAIEKDKKLCVFLKKKYKNFKNIKIINKNILNYKINKKVCILCNTPYKISNKIMNFLLNNKKFIVNQYVIFENCFFNEKYKKSNFFYHLLNFNYKIKILKFINKKNFFPNIKVNSILIEMNSIKFPYNFNSFYNSNSKILFYNKIGFYFLILKNKMNKLETNEFVIYSLYIYKNLYFFKSKKIIIV
ncbi:rRNA adenine N-6-methyltransferase family protein [Candidatus Vidania fulgoroideorum]